MGKEGIWRGMVVKGDWGGGADGGSLVRVKRRSVG